jgi:hypothetical protein
MRDPREIIRDLQDLVVQYGLGEVSRGFKEEYRALELEIEKISGCPMGVECELHNGSVHGQEAERLRGGVEKLLEYHDAPFDENPTLTDAEKMVDNYNQLRESLRELLDKTDAADSVAWLELKKVMP